jgi:hypothetical protein
MSVFAPRRNYAALAALYDAGDEIAGWPDGRLFAVAPEVSAWSPAHHLHHVALANAHIFSDLSKAAEAETPDAPEGRINAMGLKILTLGRIPRGRGRAPREVSPPDDLARAGFEAAHARSRSAFEALEPHLDALPGLKARMRHPFFGKLNAPQWLRFLLVHTRHHLAIIEDVAKAVSPQPRTDRP